MVRNGSYAVVMVSTRANLGRSAHTLLKSSCFLLRRKPTRRKGVGRFFRGRTRGYQTNWQTIQIGNKWWGLSAARMYDFATGRFTQRDPLPALMKLASASGGNVLGAYAKSKFSREILASIAASITYGLNTFEYAHTAPLQYVDSYGYGPSRWWRIVKYVIGRDGTRSRTVIKTFKGDVKEAADWAKKNQDEFLEGSRRTERGTESTAVEVASGSKKQGDKDATKLAEKLSERGAATPPERHGTRYPEHVHPEGENRHIHIQTEEAAKESGWMASAGAVGAGSVGVKVEDALKNMVAPESSILSEKLKKGRIVAEGEILFAAAYDLCDNISPVGPSDVIIVLEAGEEVIEETKKQIEVIKNFDKRPYANPPSGPTGGPATRMLDFLNNFWR